MKTAAVRVVTVAASLLTASPALAHPGHGEAALASGLASGLAHPFIGADHVLAMVAVGLLAAKRGGASLFLWPAAFVAAMLVGYAAGLANPSAGPVEPALLASVIVLGALTASSGNVAPSAGVILVAGFGACHGFAHGIEAPAHVGPTYGAGFAASTALLHAAGLGLGLTAQRMRRADVVRLLGGGVALGGLALAVVG